MNSPAEAAMRVCWNGDWIFRFTSRSDDAHSSTKEFVDREQSVEGPSSGPGLIVVHCSRLERFGMRGSDERTGALFSYVDLAARVRPDHPLRVSRSVANGALAAMSNEVGALYSGIGRPGAGP